MKRAERSNAKASISPCPKASALIHMHTYFRSMPVIAQEQQSFSFGAIRVQLIVPQLAERSGIQATHEDSMKDPFPYWAKLWPSAIALSQYIAGNLHLVAGKKVLELAAGLGLPGIVAANMAREVIISDYIPEAVSMMQASAALNGLSEIQCCLLDWNDLPADLDADVLLLSDINYEPAAFEILYAVLKGFLAKGTLTLLATPQRLMAKPFIERLLPYCVVQEEQRIDLNGETSFISVFVLSGNEGIARDTE